MRSMLLAGFALIAVAAFAPAHTQTTGGVPITRVGGNVIVPKQSPTTLAPSAVVALLPTVATTTTRVSGLIRSPARVTPDRAERRIPIGQ